MNIDWLIKKIKKHIPEDEQIKIFKREKDEDVKPKGGKRQRDPSDNEGNTSKKTKDEERINRKRLIDLVDDKYPTSG